MAITQALRLPLHRIHRIAVSVFFFIQGLCFSSWASRIPDIKMQLHLSDGELGSILFALPCGLMTSLPLSGWLVGKYGSRTGILISSLLYPVTLIFLGLAATPWQLASALFVFGLWGNMFNISVNTQAVGVEALYGRSIMASFHGLWSLASFTGAIIGTLMISLNLPPFLHFCMITSFSLLLVIFFFRNLMMQDTGSSSQPLFAKPDSALLKLGMIAFCSMVAEGVMFDWSGVYFKTVVVAPKQLVTLGYVTSVGAMAAGRFAGDWLANRFGKKTILQISGVLIAAGLLTAVLFPYLFSATLGFLLVGLGVSSVVPLVYGAAGRSKTMNAGVALAAVSTIGFLGFLMGPPTIGFIAEAASLRWSFALIAVLGFCNTLLAAKAQLE